MFELDLLHLGDHIENAIGVAIGEAGTNRMSPPLVPSPRGIVVTVILVRTLNVRAAGALIDSERVQNIGFAARDCLFDLLGNDIADLGHGRTRTIVTASKARVIAV